jgi:uncharacterized protein (DUF2237 family)
MSFRIFIKKGNDLITPKPNWDFPGLKLVTNGVYVFPAGKKLKS